MANLRGKALIRFLLFILALCGLLGIVIIQDFTLKKHFIAPLAIDTNGLFSEDSSLLDSINLDSSNVDFRADSRVSSHNSPNRAFNAPRNIATLSPNDLEKYINYINIPNIEPSAHASFIINLANAKTALDFGKDSKDFIEPTHRADSGLESNLESRLESTAQGDLKSDLGRDLTSDLENNLKGDFMLSYFAGSKEGARDVKIYQSFFSTNSADSMRFNEPKAILSAESLSILSGKFIKKLGNPVSVIDSRGRVHLFVVGVSLGGWATSKIYWLTFNENFSNLAFQKELRLNPFLNFSFLVRSGALQEENGGFILPIYYELARKFPLFLRFSSDLSHYSLTPLTALKSQLQPSFTALSPHTSIGIYRNHKAYNNAMFGSVCLHNTESSAENATNRLDNIKHSAGNIIENAENPAENPIFTSIQAIKCLDFKSNLSNYDASSIIFRLENRVFLIHNVPPTHAPKGILESMQTHSRLDSTREKSELLRDLSRTALDSTPNHAPTNARGELWLYVLDSRDSSLRDFTTKVLDSSSIDSMDLMDSRDSSSAKNATDSIDSKNIRREIESNMPKLRFIPLFRLDSAQGEVSYPSVALNHTHTIISYTYNRKYIRVKRIPNDVLISLGDLANNAKAQKPNATLREMPKNRDK